MVNADTFLTQLYVMVDDFCQSHLPPEHRPGPAASLSCSEVITLALLGQWACFESERGFFRWASRHLGSAFPRLPHRSQFNRLLRRHLGALTAFSRCLQGRLPASGALYEALDSCGVPTRSARRRGRGWLAGQADVGWSNRLGWYEGFRLLLSVHPTGSITGFGFGAASTSDQPLAETFFALRCDQHPQGRSVGDRAPGPYCVDTGFEGRANHTRWRAEYGAGVLCPPRRGGPKRQGTGHWPKPLRRWLARRRQIVETAIARLLGTFRLDRERPHALAGFQARLTAKIALYNFCIWLNRHLGRPNLAFADLLDW